MNRIDYVVRKLAPNGVQTERLGDLGTITRGQRFVKDDMKTSGVPCVHYGEIYTKYGISADQTFSYLAPALAARLRKAHSGDVIIASAGETVIDIGKSFAWLGEEDVVIHDACYAFRSELDPKYVVYFLQTDDFHAQVRTSTPRKSLRCPSKVSQRFAFQFRRLRSSEKLFESWTALRN
jgi:type I restriction enzyme S subunit